MICLAQEVQWGGGDSYLPAPLPPLAKALGSV